MYLVEIIKIICNTTCKTSLHHAKNTAKNGPSEPKSGIFMPKTDPEPKSGHFMPKTDPESHLIQETTANYENQPEKKRKQSIKWE
jgi:hypothetical protein